MGFHFFPQEIKSKIGRKSQEPFTLRLNIKIKMFNRIKWRPNTVHGFQQLYLK